MTAPLHPYTQPIATMAEADQACVSLIFWRATTVDQAHEIGDRLLEILAYRVCHLWSRHEVGRPSMQMAPVLIDPTLHGPKLLIHPLVNAGADFERTSDTGKRLGEFYDDASCLNLLGHEQAGEIIRRVLHARFGDQHENWPVLHPWRSPEQVLGAFLTPEHRARREAGLLAAQTPPAPGSSPFSPRL